jgi:hypothetical protein
MASPAEDPRMLALLAMPHDELAAKARKLEHALVHYYKEHSLLSKENESLRHQVLCFEAMEQLM